MAREGTATPVDPGLIARLVQGVRYTLTGVKPDNWFGPNQPLAPVAQEQALGRQFDYQAGFNLRQTPRANEAISFDHMRGLADGYDFLRLVIETRKDQMCSMRWTVRPQDTDKEPDDRCKKIEAFLQMPDQEHNWPTWLRMLLEDMLVLDAATIYPRKTRGGEPYSFELVDGATIKRVIDETGRTPLPPDPAYQQVLKGLPAVNYSRDELIYAMRNPRTNRVYGYSHVEQIIMTVNIAMRRQLSQLQYYTEGNIPEAMIGVPDTWNPDQIRQFQDYWDAMLEGNTAQRRHAKFIPGGMDVHETRPNMMKDAFDEWLARIVCFAFSISPSAMIAQINRATAEVSKATAEQEGLLPTMLWVKSVMDLIVARWFNAPDLHFEWAQKDDLDAKTQADIHAVYINAKVLTPDEVRADLGLDPLSDEQRDELFPPMPEALADAAEDDAANELEDELEDDAEAEEGAEKAESGSFKPPAGVRSAAKRGLELRRKWKRGGISNSQASDQGIGSGVQRATNLANGDDISMATIKRMHAFFSRHQKNYQPGKRESDGGPTAGTIAWLLWGGNAGKAWANSIVNSDSAKKAAMPTIHIHNNVQPPEVLVDIGSTTVNAQFGEPTAHPVTKTVIAERGGLLRETISADSGQ